MPGIPQWKSDVLSHIILPARSIRTFPMRLQESGRGRGGWEGISLWGDIREFHFLPWRLVGFSLRDRCIPGMQTKLLLSKLSSWASLSRLSEFNLWIYLPPRGVSAPGFGLDTGGGVHINENTLSRAARARARRVAAVFFSTFLLDANPVAKRAERVARMGCSMPRQRYRRKTWLQVCMAVVSRAGGCERALTMLRLSEVFSLGWYSWQVDIWNTLGTVLFCSDMTSGRLLKVAASMAMLRLRCFLWGGTPGRWIFGIRRVLFCFVWIMTSGRLLKAAAGIGNVTARQVLFTRVDESQEYYLPSPRQRRGREHEDWGFVL